jgi:hypothetical protein
MENVDRRTVFAGGLAAASLISNTSAFALEKIAHEIDPQPNDAKG